MLALRLIRRIENEHGCIGDLEVFDARGRHAVSLLHRTRFLCAHALHPPQWRTRLGPVQPAIDIERRGRIIVAIPCQHRLNRTSP